MKKLVFAAFLITAMWSFAFTQKPTPVPSPVDDKDVVKITTSAKTPDPDQLRRINEVVDRLVRDGGYCPVCANELLTYVGTLLSR